MASPAARMAKANHILAKNTYSPSGGKARVLPTLPDINYNIPVYSGGKFLYAVCALQIRKSEDKEVIAAALMSAVGSIMNATDHVGGEKVAPVPLVGGKEYLQKVTDKKHDETVTTNFHRAAPMTVAEIGAAMAPDQTEMAAYFGVLCLAMCKQPNEGEPLRAFNENRRAAATRAVPTAPAIFVTGSEWLTYNLLRKVHATFNHFGPSRCRLIHSVLRLKRDFPQGEQATFLSLFELLYDFGLTNLAVIRDAINRYDWIVKEMDVSINEISAANEAFQFLATIDEGIRPYAKAMYMETLRLVDPNAIKNLVGICRYALAYTHPTFNRYRGGVTTEAQEALIASKLTAVIVTPDTTVVAETVAPVAPVAPGTENVA